MKTQVHIAQEFIDNGEISRPRFCPVALGCKPIFPDITVSVYPGFIALLPALSDVPVLFFNDEELAKWILRFDDGDEVQPITIEIDSDTLTAKIIAKTSTT